MDRMNGWQRLWLILAVLTAIGTTVFGVMEVSRTSHIQDRHNQVLISYRAKIKDLEHPDKDATHGILYSMRTSHLRTVDEVKSAIRQADAEYEEDLKNLLWTQTKQIAFLFVAWSGGCLLLYGFGLTCNWVYRGFRPEKA
ncbi:hypothetical protein [Pseudomonas sp. VI4.1]|uniref:hypothetical protein n=1 Tax=Pseudomonas sp. VI4.1 TaxID=1941346 RepID=UPI0009CF495B|nr:hypothetical protein [Pseudomonas sp. VI4.1]OPK11865.1 hypothetical protein BZ163_01680 [Pseudomonas sp. VI4.1]